jgi:glucose-1-phosphate adenylyltransferase
MNIKQMIDFHTRSKADVTISCVPQPKDRSSSFGVIEVDDSFRVKGFKEKPASPKAIPGKKDLIYASMGNYIFNPKILTEALEQDSHSDTSHDFGKDIIPSLIRSKNVYAYDFSHNNIPGVRRYEEKGYWRDVGTIDSFFEAHMDLLGPKPKLDLANGQWPIYGSTLHCPPAKVNDSTITNSLISEGCVIEKVKIENSVLGRQVVVDEGVEIKDCVIMDFAHIKKNSKIKKTVIDRFNTVEPNSSIGADSKKDKEKHFVSKRGVTVVKRGPRQVFY